MEKVMVKSLVTTVIVVALVAVFKGLSDGGEVAMAIAVGAASGTLIGVSIITAMRMM